jgi:two-component sensor histidine kinase/DNA-binding response OmpR family regulator
MSANDPVNVLLVDDEPGKLLTYETTLQELGENLIKASSAREALEHLLKTDVAVVLIDVCMPELDGFELAELIRGHPRFEKIAIIFISAVLLSDIDRLRGYAMGAVDYVPVPVVPEVLRAKVRVFAELHRKTVQLERLNAELERRVTERTAELKASNALLLESERRRSLALTAGQMGSWDYDFKTGQLSLDENQHRMCGVDPANRIASVEAVRALIEPGDWTKLQGLKERFAAGEATHQAEFRFRRPDGELRWCLASASATLDSKGELARVGGVTIDITERKRTEERQILLAREVDHRARNALAVIQAIVRLTRADSASALRKSIDGRIMALARAHTLLSESRWDGADWSTLVKDELAPYRTTHKGQISLEGPSISLMPTIAQMLALAVHELATNAAKYGALSANEGDLRVKWELREGGLSVHWTEFGSPARSSTLGSGFGINLIVNSIEQQLGGSARFDWRPEGLACEIFVPLRSGPLAQEGASGGAAGARAGAEASR